MLSDHHTRAACNKARLVNMAMVTVVGRKEPELCEHKIELTRIQFRLSLLLFGNDRDQVHGSISGWNE